VFVLTLDQVLSLFVIFAHSLNFKKQCALSDYIRPAEQVLKCSTHVTAAVVSVN